MRAISRISQDFFRNDLLLLATIATLINSNLLEQDLIPTPSHSISYSVELVFNRAVKNSSASAYFYKSIYKRQASRKTIMERSQTSSCLLALRWCPSKAKKVSIFTPCWYSYFFNIPHQNIDEEGAPVFPFVMA